MIPCNIKFLWDLIFANFADFHRFAKIKSPVNSRQKDSAKIYTTYWLNETNVEILLTCVCTISLKFEFFFLVFPSERVFGAISHKIT